MLFEAKVKLPWTVKLYEFKSRTCFELVPEIDMFPRVTFEPSIHLSDGAVAKEMLDPVSGTQPNSQLDELLKAVLFAPVQTYVFLTVIEALLEFAGVQVPLVVTAR